MAESIKNIEFMKIYEPLHERLAKFCRALCRNEEEARDLLSDTVLKVYENFEKIRNNEAMLSFVFTTASRIRKRNLWRGRIFSAFRESDAEFIQSTDSSPELMQDVRLLYEMISRLPSKIAQTIVLFEISGFSLDEITQIQGGTLSGVKSRLRRGREKLKEMFDSKIQTDNITFAKNIHPTKNNSIFMGSDKKMLITGKIPGGANE